MPQAAFRPELFRGLVCASPLGVTLRHAAILVDRPSSAGATVT